MTYFLLRGSEDGTIIQAFDSEDDLRAAIAEYEITKFATDATTDTNYWGDDQAAIIKGELIIPKAKSVVKEWGFE